MFSHRRLVSCLVCVTVLFCGSVLTGCTPDQLEVTTQPSLFPAFDPAVTDYVSRCDKSAPVSVDINAPDNTTVSVAGQAPQGGAFTVQVLRDVGQSFSIVSTSAGGTATYYIRCLPSDFPTWTTTHTGPTQAEWYAVSPLTASPYFVIYDTNGVPVWWRRSDTYLTFFAYLPNGHVAWTRAASATPGGPAAEERRLDGSLVRLIDSVPAGNDFHELQLLANGHYLIAGNRRRTVDLTAIGGPASATIDDPLIQEVTASGALVWSWDTYDHIPVTETQPEWGGNRGAFDLYHFNSIGADGSGRVIISYRHLNALYDVDKTTGQIVYKLGGSTRPESLTVVNDPLMTGSGFGGQHDARILSDGTLSVHDNGSGKNRPPRAARYQIDLTSTPHKATLVEQVTDANVPSSFCCGSARRLPGGNWVMSWGGTPVAAELTPAGTRVFSLTFEANFSYRAVPIPFGQLSRSALRAGMDAQHPS